MTNSFAAPKAHDFTIQNDSGDVVGQLKVRPSSILWREPRSDKWFRVKLSRFIELAHKEGELVES